MDEAAGRPVTIGHGGQWVLHRNYRIRSHDDATRQAPLAELASVARAAGRCYGRRGAEAGWRLTTPGAEGAAVAPVAAMPVVSWA